MTAMTISTEGPKDFFGELYLRSTRPFLHEDVTDADAGYLLASLEETSTSGLVLDLGCGHGRHLRRLAQSPKRSVVGVDFDTLSLRESKAFAPVCRGDFFKLPFREGAFAAAYCWYNTLGTFEDAAIPVALAEVGRCVRPGGLFVLQATAPHSPQWQPTARYDGDLPDGSHLIEEVHYDAALHRDHLRRELRLPDGRFMAASFFIRYYALPEWEALLDAAGFEVRWVNGGVDGSPFSEASVDLIVGAQKRG